MFYMVWLLTKHVLQILIHFGTLVTPALALEYADCKCYENYISYDEGYRIFYVNHDGL